MAETIARVRHAGARGSLTLRADSGFYAGAVVSACRRAGVAFSITAWPVGHIKARLPDIGIVVKRLDPP